MDSVDDGHHADSLWCYLMAYLPLLLLLKGYQHHSNDADDCVAAAGVAGVGFAVAAAVVDVDYDDDDDDGCDGSLEVDLADNRMALSTAGYVWQISNWLHCFCLSIFDRELLG